MKKKLFAWSILLCLVVTVIGLSQTQSSVSSTAEEKKALTQTSALGHPQDNDRLRHEKLTEQPTPLAILSNGQNNYRCQSRPQRLLPVYGSKQNRTNGKQPVFHHYKQPLKRHNGRSYVPLSTPLLPFVSCSDLIVALRHIIR